jgi:hypothetical protein
MAVGVGHELVGLWGGGVEGDGMVNVVRNRKWGLLLVAIDTAEGGIYKVLYG